MRIGNRVNQNWKYVVLASSCLTTMFSAPLLGAFGVFVVPWKEYFSGSAGAIAVVTSCGAAFSGIGCPIGSLIAQKWGYQKTHILSGILMFSSFTLSAFVQSLPALFFTYSMLGGIGTALAMIGYINAVNEHFQQNLGVAFAITSTGYGIGGFLFPLLFQSLVDEYTWRGAMFITGAIMGNLIVCGCLVFPSKKAPPLPCQKSWFSDGRNESEQIGEVSDIEKECEAEMPLKTQNELKHSEAKGYFHISKKLFTSSAFYIMVLHNIFSCIGYFIAFGLTSLRSHYELNMTERETTILISTLGISQLIFRPVMAIPVHFKWIKLSVLYYTSHFVVGVATLLSLYARSFPAQMLYCIVVSAGWSCMSFYLVVVKTIFGSSNYNVVVGHLEVMHGVGSLVGPFIGGMIFDIAGSSQYAFLFAGFSLILGFGVLIFGMVLAGQKDKLIF